MSASASETAASPRGQLALGTAQLGMTYGVANRRGRPSMEQSHRILDEALARGVRMLDTAPAYGESEVVVGAFVSQRGPADVRITTKLPPLDPGIREGALAATVDEAVERSLERLGVGHVAIYLIHAADDLRRYGQSLVDALLRWRDAGHLGRIGVSVYEPGDVALMRQYPELMAIQFPLNLLDRRMVASGCLAELHARGVTTFARSVYLQGLLAMDRGAIPERLSAASPWLSALDELLERHGLGAHEAALPYVAETDGVDYAVVGMEAVEQLRANVAALGRRLPPEFRRSVEQALAHVPVPVIDPRTWAPRRAV